MNPSPHEAFSRELFSQQHQREGVPANREITGWAKRLICLLYPQQSTCVLRSQEAVDGVLNELQRDLVNILCATTQCQDCDNEGIAEKFFKRLPRIFHLLNTDIQAILAGDPAAHTSFEVIRAYPGFFALCFYRIAHELLQLEVPLIPRILTEYAHSKTGIDIHPGATIGEHFCIDHGTGVVIGETTVIGNYVKLYQGVTLGALSVKKEMAFTKRHPTVQDNVVIYSGATILGGDTVIGHHCVIGGNVWVTESVPPGSLVHHNAEITIVQGKYLSATP
ncbi:MAG: serine O-acetyltransferase EpsC [Flavisolibacter sp.]